MQQSTRVQIGSAAGSGETTGPSLSGTPVVPPRAARTNSLALSTGTFPTYMQEQTESFASPLPVGRSQRVAIGSAAESTGPALSGSIQPLLPKNTPTSSGTQGNAQMGTLANPNLRTYQVAGNQGQGSLANPNLGVYKGSRN